MIWSRLSLTPGYLQCGIPRSQLATESSSWSLHQPTEEIKRHCYKFSWVYLLMLEFCEIAAC